MENQDDKKYSVKLRCENCGKIFTDLVIKGTRVKATTHTCPNCLIESNGHQILSSGEVVLLE
jgi:hypothetical protein